jgi:GTPase
LSGFERDVDGLARGARAAVLCPELGNASNRSSEARLEEAAGLAMAIGLQILHKQSIKVRNIRPASLFGSGQIEAAKGIFETLNIDLVVVDAQLSAVQQRNLETAFEAKVIDRTGLILEIFGERAASSEGRLQVELAHLDYQAGRLVRSWTHLERQRGGFGFLGGPGETQIEADRRLIRDRMAKLRRELADLSRTRGLHRSRRTRAPWPVIALVGYTNAGKSTLFNRLTGSDVMAEDLLFATLDPTMRNVSLPGFDKAILSDTVGFVSDLPTQLVAAFHATLEEVIDADLIVHVRDIAHSDSEAQRQDVETVLAEIGAGGEGGAPVFEAWNKIDLLDEASREEVMIEASRRDDVMPISAISGEGCRELLALLASKLSGGRRVREIELPAASGADIAWLHANGAVVSEQMSGEKLAMQVGLSDADWARFQSRRFA